LDNFFFGPLKSNFKNEAAAWMKHNPQRKITRYHMARLIEFFWNKAASMCVDVSAFEPTGIYPLNSNRAEENRKCKQSHYFRSTKSENAEK
jgi:hypothetical protein